MALCLSRRLVMVFILVLIGATTARKGFTQVEERVKEKVARFLDSAISPMAVLRDFYDLRGFPNDLKAPDRETLAQKYLFSVASALDKTGLKPFYGLEDGTFLGYFNSDFNQFSRLFYREPGNSGFNLSDPSLGKFIDACVDSQTGESTKCLLTQESGSYISCIDDCEYVSCPNNTGILCQNYEIKKYSKADGAQLGFVPGSRYCVDEEGKASEQDGEVLKETKNLTFKGSCTFKNGAPVRRNVTGDFADCRDLEKEICAVNDTSRVICDTTFKGAYESLNYDARFRGWYIDTRKEQVPRFSDPYVFFGPGVKVIGITYSVPLYMKNEIGQKLFSGVLAVDMELEDVSNFLLQFNQESTFTIAIYEDQEPYNLIGVSTESPVISLWLIEDETKPCPKESIDIVARICKAKTLTIENFESSMPDTILRKAHEAFAKVGFQNDAQTISVREDDDDVSTPTHLARTVLYELENANLKWRILFTTEIETNPKNFILATDSMFPFLVVIGFLGFVLCLGLLAVYYSRRHERAVQFSDVQFTSAFLMGSAFLNLSTFTLLGETTNETCLMRMWVFFFLSSFMLSPLFVKAYRTYKLLGSSVASAMTVKMNNVQAWIWTLPIPLIQTLILLFYTLYDPWIAWEDINQELAIPRKDVLCRSRADGFLYVQSSYSCLLLSTGCVLAYLTRNIDPRFGDAKALLFAMYNIAFTTLMIALVISTVDSQESANHVLHAIGVFWGTVFSSAAFVLPRLIEAKKDRLRAQRQNSRLRIKLSEKRKANRINSHRTPSLITPQSNRFQTTPSSLTHLHEEDDSLKILVCTANIGNAEPTLDSMRAWIPEHGKCSNVTPMDGDEIDCDQFDMIVIGMQEAKWAVKRPDNIQIPNVMSPEHPRRATRRGSLFGSFTFQLEEKQKQDAFLAAVEGADVVQARGLIQQILGDDYTNISQDSRGQMRLSIWAVKDVAPGIRDIKVTGVNTGVGNLLSNKGGIVTSMIFHETRLTFLSAHLAAHEGDRYYNARCNDMYNILKHSKVFELGNKHSIDSAISSHHMFVLGDLNFRTKFNDSSTTTHEERFEQSMKMIREKDWKSLYRFDELHKGVRLGDLMVDFDTLPCHFNPTFKVERTNGYNYKDQRIPSYTDRILFKSSPGLRSYLRTLCYEPCEDFITSDHKPVRGAFSIVPNDMIASTDIEGRYRLEFKELECSELLNGEGDSCNPFVRFIWDSIGMKEEGTVVKLDFWKRKKEFPTTSTKYKNPNPRWKRSFSLVTTTQEVRGDATLYLCVYDQNVGKSNSILGTLALNLQSVCRCRPGQMSKEMYYDRPLQQFGKPAGSIRFKVELSMLVG